MSNIGNRIHKLRIDHSMTQKAFADSLGITSAHISKVENGISYPSEALLKHIASVYDVNFEWLKTGEGPVYLDDLNMKFDFTMSNATNILNQTLKPSNPIVKFKIAILEETIQKIISSGELSYEENIEYLNLLTALFSEIEVLTETLKRYNSSKTSTMNTSEMENIINYQSDCIKKQVLSFKNIIKNDFKA